MKKILILFLPIACVLTLSRAQSKPDANLALTGIQNLVGNSGLLKTVTFLGKEYVVCEADPLKYNIEAFNKIEPANEVYTFSKIFKQKGRALIFAMNGGMYEPDLSPVGLFISGGKTLKEINLNTGFGNFYQLQPNGVFIIDDNDKPHLIVSKAYSQNPNKIKLATQSGPMLVVNGIYNENFKQSSPNLNIRNGVGINKKGDVVFVISKEKVNFYEFAQLFETALACDNALYLDGTVSQYFAPELQKAPSAGSILGVFITVSYKSR